MSANFPRNPNTQDPLTIDKVEPGVAYRLFQVVRSQEPVIIEEGIFTEGPQYGKDGWFGALAIVGSNGSEPVDVYAMGLVPSSDGTWPDVYATGVDLQRLAV